MWFKQYTCSDKSECIGCKSTEFAQNMCLPAAGGGGANATCFGGSIYIMYFSSSLCSGQPETTQVSNVGTCLTATDGTRFFFECPDSFSTQYIEAPRSAPASLDSVLRVAPLRSKAGNFTQYTCDDVNCFKNCKRNVFPEHTCLRTTDGGSAIAECDTFSGDSQIIFSVFSTVDCTGSYKVELSYLDTCLFGPNSHILYSCPPVRSRRLGAANSNAVVEIRP